MTRPTKLLLKTLVNITIHVYIKLVFAWIEKQTAKDLSAFASAVEMSNVYVFYVGVMSPLFSVSTHYTGHASRLKLRFNVGHLRLFESSSNKI